MITRRQAFIASKTTAPVFDPDGMEVTVTWVHPYFDSVVGETNSGDPDVWRFDELSPGRDLLRFDGEHTTDCE